MTPPNPQLEAETGIQGFFNENGYYVARGLIDEATTSRILDDFRLAFTQKLRHLGLPVDEGTDNTSLCQNMRTLLEHDAQLYLNVLRLASRFQSVFQLMFDERILEVLRNIGMKNLSLTAGVAAHVVSRELQIPGGYMGWAPHQDWTAGQGSLKQTVIWAPLMDIPEDFYPLTLIPGSHRRGVWKCNRDKVISRGALIQVDESQYSEDDWVSVTMARGDVAFMSGFTVHTTGEGKRDGVRIACGTRYEDITEETFVERGYPSAFSGQTATQEELFPGFPTPEHMSRVFGR